MRGDLDSGGAPALAYIDGRRRAGRMESASWTAGWAEREREERGEGPPPPPPPPPNQQPRGAWGGWARCVADSSRRVQREKLAAGRLSTTLLGESGMDGWIPRSVRRGLELPLLTRALPTRSPGFPRFCTPSPSACTCFFATKPLASLRELRRGPFRFFACFSLRSVQVNMRVEGYRGRRACLDSFRAQVRSCLASGLDDDAFF